MRDLSRHRAQIERRVPGVRRSARDGARNRFADAADAHPQRADASDAQSRLRQGLCLRSRYRGRLLRPELFSGRGYEAQFLPAGRARVRAGDPKAARILGQAAPTHSRTRLMTRTDHTLTVDSRTGTLRLDRWFKRLYPALCNGQVE